MHIPTALNPGQYTAPAGESYVLTIILAAVSAVIFVTIAFMASAGDSKLERGVRIPPGFRGLFNVLSGVLILATVGTGVTYVTTVLGERTATSEARASYNTSVASWLNADYGIDVNRASARDLIHGDPLVVSYKGADTMVQIVDRTDDDLAVRIPDGALLRPLKR